MTLIYDPESNFGPITGTGNITNGVSISRRVSGPIEFSATFDIEAENPYPAGIDLTCEWNHEAQSYEVKRLTLTRRSVGGAINGKLLRRIPVDEATKLFVRHAISQFGYIRSSVFTGHLNDMLKKLDRELPSLKEMSLQGKKLEWVSLLYEVESILGIAPTQSISNLFNVSLRTATNWVREAKDQHLLDSQPNG